MRKVIFLVFVTIFVATIQTNAQDAKSTFKKAKKALNAYHSNELTNFDKLEESIAAFEAVPKDSEVAMVSNFCNMEGEAYNDMANAEFLKMQTTPAYKRQYPDAGSKAFNAYSKALEYATKKYHKKEALKGIFTALGNTSEEGRNYYAAGEFDKAYNSFSTTFKIHDLLKKNDKESPLDAIEDYKAQKFVKVLCAEKAGKIDEVVDDLESLYNDKYENAHVYTAYFNYLSASNPEKAMAVLNQGREIYPDDQGLMYAEINYFLKMNKTDVLVDKLKVAIEKDPQNESLYSTLGNVYDKIYQTALEAKDDANAELNFNEALKYYNKALELKPDFFDATYSIGALYYNKAASMTTDLNKLGEDYSKAGMKKYDAFKVKVDEIFAQAMPYFKKAEAINGKDMNTLIALKELTARSGDLEGSNDYKAKIDALK